MKGYINSNVNYIASIFYKSKFLYITPQSDLKIKLQNYISFSLNSLNKKLHPSAFQGYQIVGQTLHSPNLLLD